MSSEETHLLKSQKEPEEDEESVGLEMADDSDDEDVAQPVVATAEPVVVATEPVVAAEPVGDAPKSVKKIVRRKKAAE